MYLSLPWNSIVYVDCGLGCILLSTLTVVLDVEQTELYNNRINLGVAIPGSIPCSSFRSGFYTFPQDGYRHTAHLVNQKVTIHSV